MTETLHQDLNGWPVVDALVTLTACGYEPPGSTAGDFRKLTAMVLRSALRQAGTVVCEPICRFELEIPADTLSAVLSALGDLRAVASKVVACNSSVRVLHGDIPSARVHELQQRLPSLTGGEGVLEYAFHRYELRI